MNFCSFALLALFAVAVGAELYCSRPKAPIYGYINAGHRRNYKVGSSIIIKCNRGYQLIGRNSLKCLSRGRNAYWNYRIPVCKKVLVKVCRKLADPRYGDVRITGVKVGAKAVYTCNRGFKLIGNTVRQCQRNGQWSGRQPICQRIVIVRTCPKLPDPRYGDVRITGVKVGAKATYTCNRGFKLIGSTVRKCQNNGQWSGRQPVCQKIVVTCPKLFDPRNGNVNVGRLTVGSTAKYSCDRGFDLQGNRVRKCQRNGRWSGSNPVCKKRIVTCQRLIDPNNGDVDLSGLRVGSKATYSCDKGFKLRGNQIRKCQSNGQWSGSNPVCIKIVTCSQLSDPRNGDVDVSGISVGSRAKYSCDKGFELRGNRVRTCQQNGQWSGSDAVCIKIIVTCEELIDPENGDVQLNGIQVGSKATYSCDQGFKLVGNQIRTCQQNGQWSGNEPFCKKVIIIQCPPLPKIKYGNVFVTGLHVGSQAHYLCDYGYVLKGVSPLRCLSNGYWSSKPPVCAKFYADDDNIFHDDDIFQDDDIFHDNDIFHDYDDY